MPCTPMAERASRTSSSLNGLMMAVTSFMVLSGGAALLEGPGDEADRASLGPLLPEEGEVGGVGVGVLPIAAGSEAVAEVVRGADLPHGVVEVAVVEAVLRAGVTLVAHEGVQRELLHDRVVHRELEVVGALAVDHAEDLADAVRILEGRGPERHAEVHLVGVRLEERAGHAVGAGILVAQVA